MMREPPDSDGTSTQSLREMQNLRDENADLQATLDRTLTKLMRLQGGLDQISDGQVQKRLESLWMAIEDWVTDIEIDLLQQSRDFRKDSFEALLAGESKNGLLWQLGLYEQVHDRPERKSASYPQNDDYAKMKWLGTLSSCIQVVLSRHIWYFINRHVFQKHPSGVVSDAGIGIDYIERAIAGGCEGGEATGSEAAQKANKWRAKAMATLVPTREFQRRKALRLKELKVGLETHTSKLVYRPTLDEHIEALATSVLYPAVDLRESLACSSTVYAINELNLSPGATTRQDHRLQDCKLKDVVDLRVRGPSDTCGIFCTLFPGVYRISYTEKKDLPILKPVVLVWDKDSVQTYHSYKEALSERRPQRSRSPRKQESRTSSPSQQPTRSRRRRLSVSEQKRATTSRHGKPAGRAVGLIKASTWAEEGLDTHHEKQPLRRNLTDELIGGLFPKNWKLKKIERRRPSVPTHSGSPSKPSSHHHSPIIPSNQSSREHSRARSKSIQYNESQDGGGEIVTVTTMNESEDEEESSSSYDSTEHGDFNEETYVRKRTHNMNSNQEPSFFQPSIEPTRERLHEQSRQRSGQ